MRFRPSIFLPAAALVLAACGGGGDSSNNSPTSPGTPSNPNPPSSPPPVSGPSLTNQITISDNVFSPSSIKVAPNTDVKWTWAQGASVHNVTISDGSGSGDKSGGDSFTKTFATAGTFDYRCTIHLGMSGSVLVAP